MPWHVWIEHPELAGHADCIAVRMLPYWEGVEVESAVGCVRAWSVPLRRLLRMGGERG